MNRTIHTEVKSDGVMSCNETTTKADKLTHSNVEVNQHGANVFCFLSSLPPFSPSHNGL
jgi:hypothetical protein